MTRKGQKPKSHQPKSPPGWPQVRPCLGYCGQDRLAQGPWDRVCESCKLRQMNVGRSTAGLAELGRGKWE